MKCVLSLLLVCIAGQLLGADEKKPAPTPLIAFQTSQFGGYDVCVIDNDGKNFKRLTHGGNNGLHFHPHCWSPDGTKLAFASGAGKVHEICVINADGSGRRQLTDLGLYSIHRGWSKNGDKVIFSAGKNDGHWSLYAVEVKTLKTELVKKQFPLMQSSPVEIDESKLDIAFNHAPKPGLPLRSHDGKKQIVLEQENGITEAFIADADGTKRRKLVMLEQMLLHMFVWSADDQYIAFIASPQAVPFEFLDDTPEPPHTPGLYIVHVNGAMPVRLEAAGENAIRPVWQPMPRD